VLKKSPIFRDFFPLPIFTPLKVAIFMLLKKSRLLLKVGDFFPKSRGSTLKVVGRPNPRGIRPNFEFFFVISKFLLVEKEGEGFVVFLNHCGGNLTTIIITIKDF
jgi:hypothetical protein